MTGKNLWRILAFAAILIAPAAAADVTGTWTASFDTQVGVQNYTYTFKVEGSKLTAWRAKEEEPPASGYIAAPSA